MYSRTFLGIFVWIFSVCNLFSAPPKKTPEVKTSGVFSDMSISQESGDVGGLELFFFSSDKDYVVINRAEGELQKPQLAEVQQNGNDVQFVMKTSGVNAETTRLQFRGTFSARKLSGRFSDGQALNLPRKRPMFMTTYSDLTHIPERGKVVGLEIIKILADRHYVLLLQGRQQMTFGEATCKGDSLQFGVKNPDGSTISFQGRTSKTFLNGTLSQDGHPSLVKLPAKKSYWE